MAFGDAAVTALEIGYDTYPVGSPDDSLGANDDRIMNETFDSTYQKASTNPKVTGQKVYCPSPDSTGIASGQPP